MAYKINIEYFNKKLTQSAQLKNFAIGNADRKFEAAHTKLLKEFNNHVITKEIEAGPHAESKVLDYGNLFSFIGFDAGDKPIEPLRNILTDIEIDKNPELKGYKNSIVFRFNVSAPDTQLIESNTPMPEWDDGSWVTKIERGISGLEYYLFSRTRIFPNSRSGPAIQIKKKLRNSVFGKNIEYLTDIFNDFRNRLL